MDKQKSFAPIKMSYDREADVLYLSMGNPREAVSDMEDNGVIIRRDPTTKKVVGFTVVDFIKNFSSIRPKMINPHLKAKFQIA